MFRINDNLKLKVALVLNTIFASLQEGLLKQNLMPILDQHHLDRKFSRHIVKTPRNGRYAVLEMVKKGAGNKAGSIYKWIAPFEFRLGETLPASFEEISSNNKEVINSFLSYYQNKKGSPIIKKTKKVKKNSYIKRPTEKDPDYLFEIITNPSPFARNLTKELAAVARIKVDQMKKDLSSL
jgi:hypothetical protein